MSAAERPLKLNLQTFPWRRVLPCLTVFVAAFLLFGMLWPAMSPGVRASVNVDFCLPETASELSDSEIALLKTVIATQVAGQLTGQNFDSLIKQTQSTGKVVSDTIEYFDRETIANNIELGFAMGSGGGRLQIDYICQGDSDQLRFLQLLGQRSASSIEDLALNPQGEILVGNQLNDEKFDRAIWLANQIQSDLDQIRDEHNDSSKYGESQIARKSPYAFASATQVSTDQSQQPSMTNALDSIDATSLTGLLSDIKSETGSRGNGTTFSVLKVDPVKARAINATPDRWAMVGLLSMAGLVSCFFALYQFAPTKQPTSVDKLSESLGIPVVAVLPTNQNSEPKLFSVEFFSTLASTLYLFSKIFLIALSVVIIGFVLIDSSIRESFFRNPFDGVAKIFRVFFGHA